MKLTDKIKAWEQAKIISKKMSLMESSHYKTHYKAEMISSMIATGMPTCRMLSQPLIFKEVTMTSAFKAHNLPESYLATCKDVGTLRKSALIYKSAISNDLKRTGKNLIPVQTGWTWNGLVLMLNFAKQLKHNSQKWDDDVDRSVQFCNKIDEVMNQYHLLYNEIEIHRRQLPITAFFPHF